MKDEITKKILKELMIKKNITYDELANKLYFSRRLIANYMRYLKKTGIIKREGSKKYGYYVIIRKK